MVNLFFCGDIMPGGVLPYQDKYASLGLMEYMQSFDYRIGTLESAIGTNMPFDPIKLAGRQNLIYAREEDLYRIKEMGFDIVSLANNHVGDLGRDGLVNTMRLLKENGIDVLILDHHDFLPQHLHHLKFVFLNKYHKLYYH